MIVLDAGSVIHRQLVGRQRVVANGQSEEPVLYLETSRGWSIHAAEQEPMPVAEHTRESIETHGRYCSRIRGRQHNECINTRQVTSLILGYRLTGSVRHRTVHR